MFFNILVLEIFGSRSSPFLFVEEIRRWQLKVVKEDGKEEMKTKPKNAHSNTHAHRDTQGERFTVTRREDAQKITYFFFFLFTPILILSLASQHLTPTTLLFLVRYQNYKVNP